MSTDGSKIPAIRGSRIFASDLTSSVRTRTRVHPPQQPHSATGLHSAVENSLWQPFNPDMDRYKSAAEKARQEKGRQISEEVAELSRLRQRHEQQQPKVAPPPETPQPDIPNASDLLGQFGANALVQAHFDVQNGTEDIAAKLDKARVLTAASNAGSGQYSRDLDIAARAQRLNAAQQQAREEIHRGVNEAQRDYADEERRRKYLEALAEEHSRRTIHREMVRDLLLESYTHQYTDYEPVYTGKAAEPFFLEPYPNQVPLVAEGNYHEVTIGPSGVPHGHAFQAPNQAKYDHTTDQYTNEVKPFYEEGSPFEHKAMAGELTIDDGSSS
jgi:hypothetical protein